MSNNKLVRDNIPQIMAKNGQKAVIRILNDAEYSVELEKKLDEEVREFHEDKKLEELADILEVVYALCEAQGHTAAELQAVYDKKHAERGGFAEKLFLIDVTQPFHEDQSIDVITKKNHKEHSK